MPADVAHPTDVAVIGAGIAGLAVAEGLFRQGHSVAVYEARDRVGGRLLSVDGSDLGATWFWANEPLVNDLIRRLGLEVFPQHLAGDAMYHQPEGAQRIDGNPIDAPSGRLTAGMQALPLGLAALLPQDTVRLEHGVERVVATGDHLELHGPWGAATADHVVLALPPALVASSIDFEPTLPDRAAGVAANTPVWMGAITKVVARYAHAFWREVGLAGSGISHIGPLREIHDMSGPNGRPAALFGFAPATSAEQLTPTAEQVRAQLVAMFGPQAAETLELTIHDWRHERYTSPPAVEALGAYQTYGHEVFAEPLFGGRVHWSSTETGPTNPGHIEGALAAAERTIQTILRSQGS